ncbi:hypothetical protein BGW80DRAFT_1348437 [Lactifluus volemus]|nr:hypothetical protein BGW80DRAFT_1348437 [Lactifluus volemus]
MPPCPPRGPKLFFTSAKTGAGVSDVCLHRTACPRALGMGGNAGRAAEWGEEGQYSRS